MKAMITAAFFAFVLGGSAYAQEPAATSLAGNFNQACSADVENFCATAQTQKERRQCIRSNRSKISDSCRTFLANRRALHQQKQASAQGGPVSQAQSLQSSDDDDGQ